MATSKYDTGTGGYEPVGQLIMVKKIICVSKNVFGFLYQYCVLIIKKLGIRGAKGAPLLGCALHPRYFIKDRRQVSSQQLEYSLFAA